MPMVTKGNRKHIPAVCWTWIIIVSLTVGTGSAAQDDRGIKRINTRRVALVIGNGNYDVSPLRNPVNDADDMEKVLKTLKFTVIKGINLNKREMLNHLSRFSTALRRADVGLFFFGGHGIQFNNRNYLIPVGCTVADETDVEFESLDAGRVIKKMAAAGSRLNIVILDACRNNPFHRSFRSTSQGLARMDAPKGTIIAYATSPGSVASDGTGRNGTYTRHLLSAFPVPGLNIQDIFNQAGMGVMEETGDKQIPWTSNTPIPRYFLAGGPGGGGISDSVSKGWMGVNVKDTENIDGVYVVQAYEDEPAAKAGIEPGDVIKEVNGEKIKTPSDLIDNVSNMNAGESIKVKLIRDGIEKITMVRLEKRPPTDTLNSLQKGSITVKPTPSNSIVRILNIKPKYKDGIVLNPGQYNIEVSAKGYKLNKQWVTLKAGQSLIIDVELEKKPDSYSYNGNNGAPQKWENNDQKLAHNLLGTWEYYEENEAMGAYKQITFLPNNKFTGQLELSAFGEEAFCEIAGSWMVQNNNLGAIIEYSSNFVVAQPGNTIILTIMKVTKEKIIGFASNGNRETYHKIDGFSRNYQYD